MTTRLDDIRDTLRDKGAAAADTWSEMGPGRRRAMLAGLAAVALAVAGLLVWKLLPSKGAGRLLEDPVAVAKFINSRDFKESPADGRRPYMKAARKFQQQLAEARRAGEIDKQTYRAAYLASWMERRVDDMGDYYAQPPAKRRAHIDEMLDHPPAAAADSTAKANVPQTPAPAVKPKDASSTSLLYDEGDAADKQEFEAMKDRFEDNFLDAWPIQRKEQYKQFRKAYTDRRKQLESSPAPSATGVK